MSQYRYSRACTCLARSSCHHHHAMQCLSKGDENLQTSQKNPEHSTVNHLQALCTSFRSSGPPLSQKRRRNHARKKRGHRRPHGGTIAAQGPEEDLHRLFDQLPRSGKFHRFGSARTSPPRFSVSVVPSYWILRGATYTTNGFDRLNPRWCSCCVG